MGASGASLISIQIKSVGGVGVALMSSTKSK